MKQCSDLILAPECVKFTSYVEVTIKDNNLFVKYVKNQEFIDLVKSFEFKWNGAVWHRKINKFNGSIEDRATELIINLILNGFKVLCPNELIKEKVLSSDYEKEKTVWIVRHNDDYVGIRFFKRNDKIYETVRKIKGRWDSNTKSVLISYKYCNDILELQKAYNLGITEDAKAMLNTELNNETCAKVVSINEQKENDNSYLKDILNSDCNIMTIHLDEQCTSYSFKTKLLDYQCEAVNKLKTLKIGALFMEQGTGKTRTALELINKRLVENKVSKVLWLCPCSVKRNLKSDIIKHLGDFPDNIRIVGIETLSSSIKANVDCRRYADSKTYLIVDESLLVKNPAALRTKNIIALSEQCEYKLILNGTPISRTEADLFTQFYILDWRILGYQSYWGFSANHLELDETGRVVKCLNVDYLAKKIAPYSVEIKKNDVLELPKKIYQSSAFNLTKEQEEEYRNVANMFLCDVDEFRPETLYRLFTALQLVLSGRKIVSGLREHIKSVPMFQNIEDNPRIKACDKIISEYAKTKTKCIIFCKYSAEIEDLLTFINTKFGDTSAVSLYGEMNAKERNVAIECFKCDSTFLVANKTCAGLGLNLQFCSNIVFYSNDWNYATRVQAEDRCHRIGQQHDVIITDIYAHNKLDERIFDCISNKKNLLDSFKASLKSVDGIKKLLG